MQQRPKHIMKNCLTRNHRIGKERRLNLTKQTLDKTIHFPKSVSYEDIDNCVFDWLNKDLYFEYDGIKYPTYKLFTNQRIGEYGQMWQKLDDKGNLEVNFKTLTREPNPQKGDNQGGNMNIPGYRDYPIFEVMVTDENGYDHKEIYCMKQPSSIDLLYTVSVITSSYRALNLFNERLQIEFNSIQKYIFPNGFAMPLTIESISDESETQIDDRKYYAQSFQIKCHAFIVREEDYTVKLVPIRQRMTILSDRNRDRKRQKPAIDFLQRDSGYGTQIETLTTKDCVDNSALEIVKQKIEFEELYNPISGHSEPEEYEIEGLPICEEETKDEHEDNAKTKFVFPIDPCNPVYEYTFSGGTDDDLWVLEKVDTDNISSFIMTLNGEEINYEEDSVEFADDDKLVINAIMQNPFRSGEISITCFNPDRLAEG